jgi:hypothetical protein
MQPEDRTALRIAELGESDLAILADGDAQSVARAENVPLGPVN